MRARLLSAILLVSPLSAQSVRTTVYTDVDGLPSAEIRDLECAPDGSLWAVGRGGVSVFDGRSWSSTANRLEFPLDDCVAIDIDPQGRVWVAGEPFSKGLAMLPSYRRGVGFAESWVRVPAPEGSAAMLVRQLLARDCPDGGNVLVSCLSGELLEYRSGSWHTLANPGEWGSVHEMASHDEQVYCATSSGVRVLEPDGRSVLLGLPGLRPDSIRGIHVEGRGPLGLSLWTLGEDGLAVYESGALTVVEPSVPPRLFEVGAYRALIRPVGARVYYGTEHTLLRRAGGHSRVLTPADGLADFGCTDIEHDRAGNTWISTRRGITRIPPPRFQNFGIEDGLLGREVTALAELPDGSLIAAHPEGFSRLLDGEVVETQELEVVVDTPRRRILDLFVEDSGVFWIASTQAGITRVDPGGRFRSWPLPSLDANEGRKSASSVVRDGSGTLWAGGPGGLARLVGDELRPVDLGVRPPVCRRLFVGPEGRVAVATLRGGVLLATADGGWRTVRSEDDSAANSTYALHWDFAGELLVGTRAGLFVARGDRLERPGPELSLEDPVYFLITDADGRLWAGTDRGVVRFELGGTRRYTIHEGLAGQETNRAGALVDARGRLWFGTTGGLSRFQEEEDEWATGGATVALRSVEVDGRRVDPDELREVPRSAALVFLLHTVSLDLDPRVAVRFRLAGYEDEWSAETFTGADAIRYTRLPPGRYRLLVQARSSSGRWGQVTRSHMFEVPRPVWAQAWFLALAALTLFVGVFGAVRLRGTLRRSSRLTAELEGLEHSYRYAFSKSRARQVLLEVGSHRVLEANSRARELLEPRAGSLAELGLAQSARVDPARLAEGLRAAERDGDALFTLEAGDGDSAHTRRLEFLACVVELPGLDTLQVTIQDVTERRRMEETLALDQRLKSLGRLAAGIAHDFNNLLTVILGQADLGLRRASSEGEESEELRDILSAGERGAELVRQLSAFGRKQALETEKLDLNEVLREFERMLARLLGEGVRIELRLTDEPVRVLADRVELERVMANLAANASDAMPGGGSVVISTRVEGDEVLLTFADSGVGMSAEVVERAFEPFFTTKADSGGTGLGLATVYGVVQQSGGHLALRSEPGRGTEVEIRLPRVAPAEQDRTLIPTPTSIRTPSRCAQGAVLYVEDDAVVRAAGARMLGALGYEVAEAEDGLEALDILRAGRHEFVLLVTDIALPHFDGRELARLVRRDRPDLPILFVSGHVLERDAQEGWGERARFLPKPFRSGDLERALAELLTGAPPAVHD